MNNAKRFDQINNALQVMVSAWPMVSIELQRLIADATESLISQNNDETRGSIKAMRAVLDLPDTLAAERKSILDAELPAQSDSALYSSMD